jgi:hypothetical protein
MNLVILALASLAAGQGEALEVAVAHEPWLQSVHVEWGEHRVPFVRDGDRWLTVICLYLD